MDSIFELNGAGLTRSGAIILHDVSWIIRPGEHWALLGPNGSGKTMTLRIMAAALWPSTGSASLLGHAFGTCDLRKLRRDVVVVSFDLQHTFMNRSDPVLDVVVSGQYHSIGMADIRPTAGDIRKANSLLLLLGCEDMPARQFRTLSHGEQKRVIIARALMTDPKLLVLDEPCTGLDLGAREHFLSTVSQLATTSRIATVFVTHHSEEILPYVTHCFMMQRGTCLAQGEKERVLTEANLRRLFEIELTITRSGDRVWTQVGS